MSLSWIQNLRKLTYFRVPPPHQFIKWASSRSTVQNDFDDHDEDPFFESNQEEDPSVITVPLRLEKRLNKKVEKENTKYFRRMQIVTESRKGSKTQVVLRAKRPALNHYKGQTYDRQEELPLVTKGWRNKKSCGDHFAILSSEGNAFVELKGRETFESLGIHSQLDAALKSTNINAPTVIQATAIPEILKGKNNLLAAETGCGKTLAYLLPLFEQILELKHRRLKRSANQPFAIVLVPTRELAEQVSTVSSSLGNGLGIRTRLLQGGNVKSRLSSPSTKEVDILISTVSILSTLSALEVYDMSKVTHIVMDEADTLLDDSFSPDVLRFLRRFQFEGSSQQHVVQATLVSATMPRSIETILGEVIPIDTLNRITTPGLHSVMKSVPQKFLRLRKMDKPNTILNLVNAAAKSKSPMMIFGNKSETCHWVSTHLTTNGIDCIAVHGKITPSRRRGLLNQYHEGEVDVMVCTDLGSRGIDSIRTKHVVNYDFPRFLADYIHRCGRVGRVGSDGGGLITNLISSAMEVELVQQIESSVRKDESLQRVNANIKRLLNARYGMYQPIEPISSEKEE